MNGKARAPTSTPCVSLLLGHRPLCGVHLSHHALSPVGACPYPPYTIRRTGTLKTGAGIWPSLNLWNSPKTHQSSVFLWTSLPILGGNGSRSPISSCLALMPHLLVMDSAPSMTESWSLPHVLSWPFSVVLRSPIYSIALGPKMSIDASAESHLCIEGSEFQSRRSVDVCLFSRSIRTFSLPSIMKLPLILLALVAGAYLPTRRNRDSHELSRSMIYVVDKSKQPAWAYETSSMQGATMRSFGIIILLIPTLIGNVRHMRDQLQILCLAGKPLINAPGGGSFPCILRSPGGVLAGIQLESKFMDMPLNKAIVEYPPASSVKGVLCGSPKWSPSIEQRPALAPLEIGLRDIVVRGGKRITEYCELIPVELTFPDTHTGMERSSGHFLFSCFCQEIPEARSERLLKAAIAVRPAAPAGIIAIHSFSRALAITLPRLLTSSGLNAPTTIALPRVRRVGFTVYPQRRSCPPPGRRPWVMTHSSHNESTLKLTHSLGQLSECERSDYKVIQNLIEEPAFIEEAIESITRSISSIMVGAANSDPARISFLGSTEGGLAQKLDRGSRHSPFEAVYSSCPLICAKWLPITRPRFAAWTSVWRPTFYTEWNRPARIKKRLRQKGRTAKGIMDGRVEPLTEGYFIVRKGRDRILGIAPQLKKGPKEEHLTGKGSRQHQKIDLRSSIHLLVLRRIRSAHGWPPSGFRRNGKSPPCGASPSLMEQVVGEQLGSIQQGFLNSIIILVIIPELLDP
eukprot:Gb_15245 [translate_table: standard]